MTLAASKSTVAAIASFALAALASVAFVFLPVIGGQEHSGGPSTESGRVTIGPSGTPTAQTDDGSTSGSTLPERQGLRVAGVLAIPVVISGVAAALSGSRRRRIVHGVAAALLFGWVLLGLASVGLFYVPSAVAMLIATRLPSARS